MKVYSWTGAHPNFGDDLNQFLWNFLMPEAVADPHDGALLVGVGTVLSETLPAARPRVVMGSGVGYKAVPADIFAEDWRVYAVRGPLTAHLLGLPADRAVVDPAVLLPAMPDWTARPHRDAIFVPHWESALHDDWRRAAEAAGLRYVDPRGEAKAVIATIAGASLVVAESMHGAIVADAFRVPWVPVIGTHRSTFKWRDWTGSLELDYAPRRAGSWARVQARLAPDRQFTGQTAPLRAAQRPGRRPSGAAIARTLVGLVPSPVERGVIARDLAAARQGRHHISGDAVLAARQRLLGERIDQLRQDYADGKIVMRDQRAAG